MTSRQPGIMPPGTAGHAGPRWAGLVLPVAMLIIAGLAGLLGQVSAPRWDGPLHGDPVVVGVALEVVLGIMLVFTIRRLAATRARAGTVKTVPPSAVAGQLRRVLAVILGAGMIAVGVTIPVGLHQRVFSSPAGAAPRRVAGAASSSPAAAPGRHLGLHLFSLHLHLTAYLLYGLLALVFLGGVGLRVRWVRQDRPSRMTRTYSYLVAPDSQDLLEVVESGRSALRAIDDARAAIIACYVAMEASLDEHGAARTIADTPDELLTRATAMGIVHGTAAARLTALFYEARFSSHPLDRGHREAAGQALAELAAELAGARR